MLVNRVGRIMSIEVILSFALIKNCASTGGIAEIIIVCVKMDLENTKDFYISYI